MSFWDDLKSVATSSFVGPTAGLVSATKNLWAKETHEALKPEPEPAPTVSGGTSRPTQAQLIALTAIAATQPRALPSYMKQQGITLTPGDLARLKVAVDRAHIIMSHPDYGKMQINPKALATVKGCYDSMGGFGSVFGKILTAPLAAGALAASALSWGVNHVILAPTKLIGKVANWGANKGGWGNMPGYGGGSPAPGAPGAPVPGQYMPPPPPGLSPQMAASYQQRQIAAYQAQTAAQAQSDQAQQQLAAAADAANAEADALEAQNQAQADQKAALQAQYGIAPDDPGSSQMGRSRADRTLAHIEGRLTSMRRDRARAAAMGAWIRRRGQARPVLMVGGVRVAYDSLGRAQILD